ncbi:hypothetical protein DYB32_006801 [Aphanomyces invadans]|uniref:Uncharacterized protein n=1 Tax=Aphanomyces invadans TaxID=157072 RepID=A0A418ASL6_9STRA|nr:hypothetical protein DYB32_006801 [Aphanomyces invadans]
MFKALVANSIRRGGGVSTRQFSSGPTMHGTTILCVRKNGKVVRAFSCALLIVTDNKQSFTLTGNGDVLQPHDGIIGIGSGGTYALAAARALIEEPHLSAEEVARRSMKIAADICVYTNHNVVVEVLDEEPAATPSA